jgi:hypothetical protein
MSTGSGKATFHHWGATKATASATCAEASTKCEKAATFGIASSAKVTAELG